MALLIVGQLNPDPMNSLWICGVTLVGVGCYVPACYILFMKTGRSLFDVAANTVGGTQRNKGGVRGGSFKFKPPVRLTTDERLLLQIQELPMCWSQSFWACGSFMGRRSSLMTFVPIPIASRQQSVQMLS